MQAPTEMAGLLTDLQARGRRQTHRSLSCPPADPRLQRRGVPHRGPRPLAFSARECFSLPVRGFPPCLPTPTGCCFCSEFGEPPVASAGKTVPSHDGGSPLSLLRHEPRDIRPLAPPTFPRPGAIFPIRAPGPSRLRVPCRGVLPTERIVPFRPTIHPHPSHLSLGSGGLLILRLSGTRAVSVPLPRGCALRPRGLFHPAEAPCRP